MRVTIKAADVRNTYGQLYPVGSVQTVGDEYGRDLVQQSRALDTDAVLAVEGNDPFMQGSVFGTPATLPAGNLSLSDVTRLRRTGIIRVGVIGGSTDAKQVAVLTVDPGDASGDGKIMTVRPLLPAGLHDGETVRVGGTSAQPGFDQAVAFGQITTGVVNGLTFTVPYDGPAGVNAAQMSVLTLKTYTSPSFFRELNAIYKGILRMVVNVSQGSTDTSLLQARVPLVLAERPDIVIAGLGMGNLYNSGFSATAALGHLVTMIRSFIDAGVPVLHTIPGGSTAQDAAAVTWGNQVMQGLRALANSTEMYRIVDTTDLTINPATGRPFSTWFEDGSAVHPNREFMHDICAPAVATEMQAMGLAIPASGILVNSIFDRYSADASSTNLLEGFFLGTGTDVTTIETGPGTVSGTCSAEITRIVTVGAGMSAAFSLVARTLVADGDIVGFNQVIDLTFGALNNSITIELTGVAGSLAARLVARGPNKKYVLAFTLKITPSGANIVKEYTVVVPATLTYRGASRAGTLGGPITNITGEPAGPLKVAYSGLHVSPVMVTPPSTFTAPDLTGPARPAVNATFQIVGQAAGTAQVVVGRPTLREVAE